jgi:SMODS-associating 4TM effector domain
VACDQTVCASGGSAVATKREPGGWPMNRRPAPAGAGRRSLKCRADRDRVAVHIDMLVAACCFRKTPRFSDFGSSSMRRFMEGGMADLRARQNSERILDLHRAVAVSHRRVQGIHAAALSLSLAVAALGVLAQLQPSTVPAVSLIGAVWTAIYAIALAPAASRYQRTSATLQEMLDTELFGVPWNRIGVGERIPEDQVSDLRSRYRNDDSRLRDYYLVAAVPAPYDVLFCLEQNLAWGSRVRLRYAQALLSLALLWVAAGLVVGFAAGLRLPALVSGWFVPSLGLMLLCLDVYRAQLSNTRERGRAREIVVAAAAESATAPLTPGAEWDILARQVQDLLFNLRRQQARTPVWFFRRYHDRDKRAFEYRQRLLEERLNPPTQG